MNASNSLIESLENRRLMSSVSYSELTDTLTINAASSGYDNVVSVGYSSAIVLRVQSTHVSGSTSIIVNRDWNTLEDGPVRKIIFNGSGYAESFSNNTALGCEANGNAGNDTLIGGWGSDTLFGGDGDDLLLGGQGADMLEGQNGDDVLCTGKSLDEVADNDCDTLDGGEGVDTVYLHFDDVFSIKGAKNNDIKGMKNNDFMDEDVIYVV
jgi:Ca2+-binding RTX toxin-like protein